jgi:hypothetical protein
MHKTLRALPSLDFLRGFESVGRRLSFTLAADELFLTQSRCRGRSRRWKTRSASRCSSDGIGRWRSPREGPRSIAR